jgi:hypothetical protein
MDYVEGIAVCVFWRTGDARLSLWKSLPKCQGHCQGFFWVRVRQCVMLEAEHGFFLRDFFRSLIHRWTLPEY